MGLILSSSTGAESLLHIPKSVWDGLTIDEKKVISNNHFVSLVENNRYGRIISSHIENNSYINNNSMSNLGSVVGQASYIDDNWDNYSAKEQVLAGVLGALVGSALDKKTDIKMTVTYTIEFLDGSVKDVRNNQKDSHIYGVGVCLDLNSMRSANSLYCNRNHINEILSKLDRNKDADTNQTPEQDKKSSTVHVQDGRQGNTHDITVNCKLGNGTPFTTTKSKCMKVKGVIL
jgi:hypothetical protein